MPKRVNPLLPKREDLVTARKAEVAASWEALNGRSQDDDIWHRSVRVRTDGSWQCRYCGEIGFNGPELAPIDIRFCHDG